MGKEQPEQIMMLKFFSYPVIIHFLKMLMFISLVSTPLFIHLEKLPIRIWDEAHLSINAYEMYQSKNWMVTTFDTKPDMWNTKPPLMIWLQVLGMKIFGAGELALRLPAALAGLFTVFILFMFLKKWFAGFWPGFIATIILITSFGYVNEHVTRTGDYDSLLVFCLTASAFSFYNYWESGSRKHLLLSGLFIWMGIMTKGVQGLLFMPGLIFWTVIHQKSKHLLLSRSFLLTYSGAFIFAIAYYVIREQLNPGYLNAVWQNEISGRYFEVIEGNQGDFWFYYDMLNRHHFAYWFWLLPCGFFAGILSIKSSIRKLTWFCFIMISFYGLIISFSKTKLAWYAAPLFPFMAIMITTLIYPFFLLFKRSHLISELFVRNIFPYIFLFLVFYYPYKQTLDNVYFPKEYGNNMDFYKISYFLKEAVKGRHNIDGQIIIFKGHRTHLSLYQHLLNTKGVKIIITDNPELKTGDRVIVSQPETDSHINQYYEVDMLMADGNLKSYRIKGTKMKQG